MIHSHDPKNKKNTPKIPQNHSILPFDKFPYLSHLQINKISSKTHLSQELKIHIHTAPSDKSQNTLHPLYHLKQQITLSAQNSSQI